MLRCTSIDSHWLRIDAGEVHSLALQAARHPLQREPSENLPGLGVGGFLNALWAPIPALAGAGQGDIHMSVSVRSSEDQIPGPNQAQKFRGAGSLTALEFAPACGISYCVILDTELVTLKLHFPHL